MELVDLVQRLGEPKVLVIGDVMLDRYVWGDAERISQEAPVILLRADRREVRLGGASSVATMLRALGARVTLAGVVGADRDGEQIRDLLQDLDIDADPIVVDVARPSTVKERYIGRAQHKHPQQMLRVDFEDRAPLSPEVTLGMQVRLASQIRACDIVLVSDYDKGVCTPALLAWVVEQARKLNKRVIADPIRGGDYQKYRGCSAITPNRLEAGLATGRRLEHMDEVWKSAQQLRTTLDLEAAIITLDKDGMAFCHRDGRSKLFGTRPRQVYDITGAGDMVMSVLGMALAAGADYEQAIQLANVAGGLEVEKIGVATVTREEIVRDLLATGTPGSHTKVFPVELLVRELEGRRRAGQCIVFTNGCFDVLHAGHVHYLQEARAQGDLLVVGVNSDASVRGLKGESRPVQSIAARLAVLAALEAVDFACVFDAPTPLELIRAVRPHVLVKGADYRKEDVVGAAFVESYGGRVHLAELQAGYSTTRILERMRAA